MYKKLLLTIAILAGIPASAGSTNLVLELNGLEPMMGQHYEGWNIVSGKALSTGRFAVDSMGTIYQVMPSGKAIKAIGSNGVATFSVAKEHLSSSLFVLTIEPNNDMDPGPSSVHIIGGDYEKRQASLSIGHRSSLGNDFAMVMGQYILAAPTGGAANKGVWFVNPNTGQGALSLPALPQGWVYEGWVVNTQTGAKFSTGLFNDVNSADSDGAGYFAGPLKLSFPKVPGQDIVKTSILLNDGSHAVVVTVEPYPDYDPAPSAIKILKADIPMNAPGMVSMSLQNISMGAISGKARIN